MLVVVVVVELFMMVEVMMAIAAVEMLVVVAVMWWSWWWLTGHPPNVNLPVQPCVQLRYPMTQSVLSLRVPRVDKRRRDCRGGPCQLHILTLF